MRLQQVHQTEVRLVNCEMFFIVQSFLYSILQYVSSGATHHIVLRPAFLNELRQGLLDQALESFRRIVVTCVQLDR